MMNEKCCCTYITTDITTYIWFIPLCYDRIKGYSSLSPDNPSYLEVIPSKIEFSNMSRREKRSALQVPVIQEARVAFYYFLWLISCRTEAKFSVRPPGQIEGVTMIQAIRIPVASH